MYLSCLLQYISPIICIREIDEENFVQTTWPENSRIDDIRSVCGSDYVDLLPRFHSVHFSQELIHQSATSSRLKQLFRKF